MTTISSHSLATMTGLTPLIHTTTCANPQAAYQRLREQWGNIAPVELEPGIHAWLVMGYKEILTAVRQERLYSRDPHNWRDLNEGRVPPDSGVGPMMFPRPHATFADGERHRRLRQPLDDGLAHLDQRRMRRSMQAICADLIGGVASNGTADLVADYAAVIPMLAVADMFGLDTDRGHKLRYALIALSSGGKEAPAGIRRFEEILTEAMSARKSAPADDLTTSFLQHPNLRDDSEVLQSMVVMIAAGCTTTTTWIAQTLRLMLTDDRFAGRLRGGRLGVDDALDEVLWWNPPMANLPVRFARRDTELGGRRIQQGDPLILGLAAANQDMRVHTDDLWTAQGNRSHLAWGAGPHSCPAHIPARLIARTAVETALHLLRDLRLEIPADQMTSVPSPWDRCPASLPVSFAAIYHPSTATSRTVGGSSYGNGIRGSHRPP